MLAAPELGGLPYVVSGLVAAGGLAAALSTADGLLMTISNALVHDGYCQEVQGKVSLEQRVMLSKFALLGVALLAAYAATFKPAEILVLVSASFSLAAAAFLPALVLGIFWPRANARGAVAGMLAGLGITAYYMLANAPAVRTWLGLGPAQLWFGILPISAGVFGVALGTVTTVLASLSSKPTTRSNAPP
jgi:cation/acetate symporter